jgi:polysaccharide export outer membrane protein
MGLSSKHSVQPNIISPLAGLLWPVFCAILLFLSATAVFSAEKNEYVLRPGDVIAIRVVEHDEFTQRCRIRPDAMINYPIIGEIEAGGLTTMQLVKIMEEKLAPYVNNVVVSISIEQYFSNRVFVIGAVGRSGELEIFEPTDVLKILSMAGGLHNPKTRLLKIVRANGDISQVDLQVILERKGANQEETFLLYPGDTMFVPEKATIPWALIAAILSVINLAFVVTFDFVNLSN